MSNSQKFKSDLAWAANTHSHLVHRIRISHLLSIYPDRERELELAFLPEDAFMVSGGTDNETVVWTALVELADRNGGVIPTRRELASATGLALATVQTYATEDLSSWLVPNPARKDGMTLLGSIFHIPSHVKERKNLREFRRIVILADMINSPVYDRTISYCKKYLTGRVYLGGTEQDDPNAKGYLDEAKELRLPTFGGHDGFVLLRGLCDHLQSETAVVTDDRNMTLLASGVDLAVFNTAMLERELSPKDKNNG